MVIANSCDKSHFMPIGNSLRAEGSLASLGECNNTPKIKININKVFKRVWENFFQKVFLNL